MVDFFKHIIMSIITTIVQNTNRRSHKEKRKILLETKPLTEVEPKAFIGLLLLMVVTKKNNVWIAEI